MAVCLCAARVAVGAVVSNFVVHTHPSTFLFLPRAKPSPGVVAAGCFPMGCLAPPGCPFALPHPQEPFTSPPSPCRGASSLPKRRGWKCLPALPPPPPCLISVLGTWEEAWSQDSVADGGISVGLREAAPKQVHLRWQQGRGWMFKTGSVAIDS